jgi:hypothetical protein
MGGGGSGNKLLGVMYPSVNITYSRLYTKPMYSKSLRMLSCV